MFTYVCWEVLVEGIPAVLRFEILDPPFQRQEVCSFNGHVACEYFQLRREYAGASGRLAEPGNR